LVTVGAHDVTVMTDVVRTVEVVYSVVEADDAPVELEYPLKVDVDETGAGVVEAV